MTSNATSMLPTLYGNAQIRIYVDAQKKEHVALIFGEVTGAEDVLVRLHSECLTSEVLGSITCDCREQLHGALAQIAASQCGILLYLRQEGRGIGLEGKIKAYKVQQEQGLDTLEANLAIGEEADAREYDIALRMLADLQPQSIQLLTNNPDKLAALQEAGYKVQRHSLIPAVGELAESYQESKRDQFGHLPNTE